MRRVLLVVVTSAIMLAPKPARGGSSSRVDRDSGSSWPSEVKGYGRTVEEAKNDAVRELMEQVNAMLGRHQPPLVAWRPTREFTKHHLIGGDGRAGPDDVQELIGPVKSWIYPVRPVDLAVLD